MCFCSCFGFKILIIRYGGITISYIDLWFSTTVRKFLHPVRRGVFFDLGYNYEPSKWYGTNDTKWFK
jgi:hypothetical protein